MYIRYLLHYVDICFNSLITVVNLKLLTLTVMLHLPDLLTKSN